MLNDGLPTPERRVHPWARMGWDDSGHDPGSDGRGLQGTRTSTLHGPGDNPPPRLKALWFVVCDRGQWGECQWALRTSSRPACITICRLGCIWKSLMPMAHPTVASGVPLPVRVACRITRTRVRGVQIRELSARSHPRPGGLGRQWAHSGQRPQSRVGTWVEWID